MRLGLRHGLALSTLSTALLGAVALAGGCQILVGLDPVQLEPDGGSTGTGGSGGSAPATCSDGKRDADETDVDCGGSCPACADGKSCTVAGDCQSKACSQGTCVAPTCTDNVANGDETDVDCGGGSCPPCVPGKHCKAPADCDSDVCAAMTCADNVVWAKTYGDSSSYPAFVNAVGVDAAGDVAIAGSYGGTIGFGMSTPPLSSATPQSFFVARLAPDGGYQWAKSFSDTSGQSFTEGSIALAVDPAGDVLLAGNYYGTVDFCGGQPLTAQHGTFTWGDVFAVKLGPSGSCLWSPLSALSDGEAKLQGAATDKAGALYVTGFFGGYFDIDTSHKLIGGGNYTSVFVSKVDAAGAVAWSKAYVDISANQAGRSVAVDPDGNVIVAGTFQGTLNVGGSVPNLTAAGTGPNVFLVKLDPSGTPLWSKGFSGFDPNIMMNPSLSVATDGGGNILLSGGFGGSVAFGACPPVATTAQNMDVFVTKLDPSGSCLWSNRYGDASAQSGLAVATPSGGVLVAATGAGSISFGGDALMSRGGTDVFVAELDANGKHVWSRDYGGSADDTATGIAAVSAGGVFVTGTSAGTLGFEGGPVSKGATDVFLAKLRIP